MSLQYISDAVGNKTAVVIPIEELNKIKQEYAGIGQLEDDIPEWQKELVYSRRKLIDQPGQLMPLDEFLKEMELEADEEI